MNCIWGCGTLGIKALKLFHLLDQLAEWLFENESPQMIINYACACGTLGIEVPTLFRLLDQRAEWLMDNGKIRRI